MAQQDRNIYINALGCTTIEKQNIEMVERKGLGHPDSIMDGTMDAVSRALSKHYISHFGRILHHNTDKGQLSSGRAAPVFGGGEILSPIQILLSGQATDKYGGTDIGVDEIAIEAARNYLKTAVPRINLDLGALFESKMVMGSEDLVDVYERKETVANDTSFGVGYAPLSRTERLALELEEYLNSPAYKRLRPAVGTDIKVMALRHGNGITLTVAAAMIASEIKNMKEYAENKDAVRGDIKKFCDGQVDIPVDIHINHCDNLARELVYITVTGTSAEMGDAGAVGRGNRVNGLITPCRPMSLEAAAGKNPLRHVGKLYNVMATLASERIVREVPSISEVHIKLLSQIGRPINDPLIAEIRLESNRPTEDGRMAASILDEMLSDFPEITDRLVEGKIRIF